MPIEARPNGDGGRGALLTTVPRPGTVLLRSPSPPEVAVERCVDVRPGAAATFDGDRLWLPIQVRHDGERQRFERHELPSVGAAVARVLRRDGAAAIRFGDRSTCRRLLPAPVLEAIERRLAGIARREGETLVTWSAGPVGEVEPGRYDVVFP